MISSGEGSLEFQFVNTAARKCGHHKNTVAIVFSQQDWRNSKIQGR